MRAKALPTNAGKGTMFCPDIIPVFPPAGIGLVWLELKKLAITDPEAARAVAHAKTSAVWTTTAMHATPESIAKLWFDKELRFSGAMHEQWKARCVATTLAGS